jgi:hypothetical protein
VRWRPKLTPEHSDEYVVGGADLRIYDRLWVGAKCRICMCLPFDESNIMPNDVLDIVFHSETMVSKASLSAAKSDGDATNICNTLTARGMVLLLAPSVQTRVTDCHNIR